MRCKHSWPLHSFGRFAPARWLLLVLILLGEHKAFGIEIYFQKPTSWQEAWIWFDKNSDQVWETKKLREPPGDMEFIREVGGYRWYQKSFPDAQSVTFLFNGGTWTQTVKSAGAQNFVTEQDIWVLANGEWSPKDPAPEPIIKVSPQSSKFYPSDFKVDITITSTLPIKSASYRLDGKLIGMSEPSVTLPLGEMMAVGDVWDLQVFSANEEGASNSQIFTYEKIAAGPGFRVFLEKPQHWDKPYIWYDDHADGSWETEVLGAPPSDMELYREVNGSEWYVKEFPYSYKAEFLFNSGSWVQVINQFRKNYLTDQDIWVDKLGKATSYDPIEGSPGALLALPSGTVFTSETIPVDLELKGEQIMTARFSLDGSDPKENGRELNGRTQITLGADVAFGEDIILKTYAENPIGQTMKTYRFQKRKRKNWQNPTLLQGFYWYIPNPLDMEEDYKNEPTPESDLWDFIARKGAIDFHDHGFTHVWLPPPSKAYTSNDPKNPRHQFNVGYAIYDRYDLGEFFQIDSIRTKYGTKESLLKATKALHNMGIKVIADMVFNHMLGAYTPTELAYDQSFDKNGYFSGPGTTKAYVQFDFRNLNDLYPRGEVYSPFKWNKDHFDGMEAFGTYYLFQGKTLDKVNNFADIPGSSAYQKMRSDIILGADLDLEHPEVNEELKNWTKWLVDTVGFDGFRVDAIRHMHTPFVAEWAQFAESYVRSKGRTPLIFGENWDGWTERLHAYLIGRPDGSSTHFAQNPADYTGIDRAMRLFDVPLHFEFLKVSGAHTGNWVDIRDLPTKGLLAKAPKDAVTFVDNHDTVPTEKLASYIPFHTKLQAYTYILLHEHGIPCVYYRDMYKGNFVSEYENDKSEELFTGILSLIQARQKYAYGPGKFNRSTSGLLGYRRYGTKEHPGGLVYIIRQHGSANDRLTFDSIPDSWVLVAGDGVREGETFKLGNQSDFAVWAPPR